MPDKRRNLTVGLLKRGFPEEKVTKILVAIGFAY